MIKLSTIVAHIEALEPLSPTACRLAGVVANSGSTIDDMIEVIRFDQALSIAILRYANSAAANARKKIESLKDAVVRLGGARILRELLSGYLKTNFGGAVQEYGYSEKELWQHSAASALAAEVLAGYTTVKFPGLTFTTVLLHDIGKLILARCADPVDIGNVWEEVMLQKTCIEAEKKILGITHADVGAEVIQSWKLPEEMVHAVRNHHITESTNDVLTDVIKVCNIVARSIGQGIGFEGMSLAVDEKLSARMGLSHEQFQKICADTLIKLNDVFKLYDS